MSRTGYFLIADISGYTQFLAGSELEHAQAIMQALLTSLVEGIAPPMRLAKFEGDAVFCYAPAEAVVRRQTILDGIDDIYSRFSAMRERITRNTTCPCQACRRTGDLNLKFVLHQGEYVDQSIAGRSELAGTAVIVVHRLMKNHIRESTGIEAYLFVTEAAAQVLGPLANRSGGRRHEETVDGIGSVAGWVTDMAPVWQHRRDAERAWIAPGAALWFPALGEVLPISPATAWSYLLDTELRMRWIGGMTGMTVDGRTDGRVGEGRAALRPRNGAAQFRDCRLASFRQLQLGAASCAGCRRAHDLRADAEAERHVSRSAPAAGRPEQGSARARCREPPAQSCAAQGSAFRCSQSGGPGQGRRGGHRVGTGRALAARPGCAGKSQGARFLAAM